MEIIEILKYELQDSILKGMPDLMNRNPFYIILIFELLCYYFYNFFLNSWRRNYRIRSNSCPRIIVAHPFRRKKLSIIVKEIHYENFCQHFHKNYL